MPIRQKRILFGIVGGLMVLGMGKDLFAQEKNTNLIKNPGFEVVSFDTIAEIHGPKNILFPKGWNSGTPFFFRYRDLELISVVEVLPADTSMVRSGERAIKLKGSRRLAQNDEDVYINLAHRLEITPTVSHLFSVWIKTEDVDFHGAHVQFADLDKNGKWLSGWLKGSHFHVSGTRSWEKHEVVIEKEWLHPETKYLTLFLRLKSFTGYAYFDDVSLTPLDN